MSEPIDVVREYLELMEPAVRDRDPDVIARRDALVADDVVYQNKPFRALHGKAEWLGWKKEFAGCEYMRGTIRHIAADGDFVLTERVEEWSIGGVRVGGEIMGIFEVRDGKIVRWTDHLSYIDEWRSSGQLPPEFFERWA